MVTGAMVFGSLGCFLFFIILGNYALWLQLSGGLDVVSLLDAKGPFVAIFAVFRTLPLSWIFVLAFTILAVLFTATSFDTSSYILSSVVQKNVSEEPMAWNRLFWALALTFLPAVLLVVGRLDTLQTAAIVGGIPLIIIAVMLCASTVMVAGRDLRQQTDYIDPIINIADLPHVDAWTPEGAALGKFDKRRAEAGAANAAQKEALEALLNFKHLLKRRYGPFGTFRPDSPQGSAEEQEHLKELETAYNKASQRKIEAIRIAQIARAEFDRIMAENATSKASAAENQESPD